MLPVRTVKSFLKRNKMFKVRFLKNLLSYRKSWIQGDKYLTQALKSFSQLKILICVCITLHISCIILFLPNPNPIGL